MVTILFNPDHGQVCKVFPAASRLKRLQRCGEESSGLCHLVHVWFVFQSVSIGMSE